MDDDTLTPIWKALSDPTRRGILDLLKQQPRTTGEVSENFDHLSRFAIMKHLSVLEEAGLIVVRPKGRERWNHLNAVPLQQIYERWIRPYEAHWASSLLNLKSVSENQEAEAMPTNPLNVNAIHIEQEVRINAPAAQVFDSLLDVNSWWNRRYSNTSAALVLEDKIGGRFYELFQGEEGALYGIVTHLEQGKQLIVSGSIGMSAAITALIQFDLEAQGDSTLVKLSHRAIGQIDETTIQNYSRGWEELIQTCLKQFVEQGIHYSPEA